MKTFVSSALLVLIMLSVFTSCKSYVLMHYKNSELDKAAKDIDACNVYIHSKNRTWQVEKTSLSSAGIKGELTQIKDREKIAEIKNPHTHGQLKRHKHDLNIYTKTEIKDSLNDGILKKEDITDISRVIIHKPTHSASKTPLKPGDIVGVVLILGINALLWVGLAYTFQGKQ